MVIIVALASLVVVARRRRIDLLQDGTDIGANGHRFDSIRPTRSKIPSFLRFLRSCFRRMTHATTRNERTTIEYRRSTMREHQISSMPLGRIRLTYNNSMMMSLPSICIVGLLVGITEAFLSPASLRPALCHRFGTTSALAAAPAKDVWILPSEEEVTQAVHQIVEQAAKEAIAERGHFALAIPGGSLLKVREYCHDRRRDCDSTLNTFILFLLFIGPIFHGCRRLGFQDNTCLLSRNHSSL